jgi:hypothetical protein
MRRTALVLLLAACVALTVSAPVLAGGSPSDQQYENVVSGVAGERARLEGRIDRVKPTLLAAAGGALPFTGFAAGSVLVGSIVLTAAGFVIRRHSRRRDA